MKIYTKTGDKGYTSLIGGSRVLKHHIRIESYGMIDELNSYVGLIRDFNTDAHHKNTLKEIQDRLFTIGSVLASEPGKAKMIVPDLLTEDVELLEKEIDDMNKTLPELRKFILPGGSMEVSFCHIARCVCRRAERAVVQLSEEDIVDQQVIIYLNRLSDYLFVLSRMIGFSTGVKENEWVPRL